MPDSNAANRIFIGRLLMLAGLLCMSMQATSDALAAPSVCASLASPPCHQRLATGVALAYIETGPASGPAVIMVHGLADSLQSWAPAMHALAAIDPRLHLIAVDLRGHGASGMPPARRCAAAPQACFRTKDFAADIAALMDAKKIRHATLVGHSLGSFVVQELALTRPQRVERAVLVATSATAVGNPVLRDVVLRDIVEGPWKKALERPGRAWPAGFYSLTPLEADPQAAPWIAANLLADPLVDPAFMAVAAARTASVRMGTWIGATRALLSTDNTRRLKTLTVPTLVLWGLQDTIFTSADQDTVKSSLAEAARRHGLAAYWKPYGVLPLPRSGAQESDIGHNVQWTAPRAVARDIAAFIENGKPTRDQVHAGSAPRLLDLVTVPGQAAVTVIGH